MGDNPLLYVGLFILIGFVFVLLMCVLVSFLVVTLGVKHADKMMDRYQKEVLALLPCTDCGKCGCESCALYADKVLHMDTDTDLCPLADEGVPEQLEKIRKRLQDELTDPTPPRISKKFGGRPDRTVELQQPPEDRKF